MGVTNKSVYEARTSGGEIYGKIGPMDWNRFQQTAKFLPYSVDSIMDCGCDRGHWLSFITSNMPIKQHLGIDISAERIAEAKKTYPGLNVKAA